MNDIFGLSFSNSALQIAHTKQNDDESKLVSIQTFTYPFEFNFEHLFDPDNLNSLANIIKQQKDEKKITDLSLNVSLPLNFAYLKKIALPLDAEQEVIRTQVEWELSHYLPGELSDFKVVKTDSSFAFSSYKEVLFICLNKKIIQNINSIAQLSSSSLSKLVVDSFSVERFLSSNNISNENESQIVFKIDSLQIITHFFIKGQYYISYLNNINPLKKYNFEDKLVKLAKEHYKNVENISEQLPLVDSSDFQVFAYGNSLTDELHKKMQQNFSCPIDKLPVSNYPDVNGSEVANCIEALGSCVS